MAIHICFIFTGEENKEALIIGQYLSKHENLALCGLLQRSAETYLRYAE